MDLVFRDICASVDGRQILRDVSGLAKKGTMLAIMGSSGKCVNSILMAIELLNVFKLTREKEVMK